MDRFQIALWDGDEYFFNEDDLIEHLAEMTEEDRFAQWFTTCKKSEVPYFDMRLLVDYLGDNEAALSSANDLNEQVAKWIKENVPVLWEPTGKRLCNLSCSKSCTNLKSKRCLTSKVCVKTRQWTSVATGKRTQIMSEDQPIRSYLVPNMLSFNAN